MSRPTRTARSALIGSIIALAGAVLPGASVLAQIPPPDIEGTTSGIFTNPVTGPDGVVTGVGTSMFTWGTPLTPSDFSSSLTFTGASPIMQFGMPGARLGQVFSLGTLDYTNGTIVITPDTGASQVDLEVSLNLTLPSGTSTSLTTALTLITTPNDPNDPVASADTVILGSVFPTATFTDSSGLTYTLQIKGFGGITMGGFSGQVTEFFVEEGLSASAQLVGFVTICPPTYFDIKGSVPGTGEKMCYRGNVTRVGTQAFLSATVLNPNSSPVDLVLCAMTQEENSLGTTTNQGWFADVVSGQWQCTHGGAVSTPQNHSFHFGCKSLTIPASGTESFVTSGTMTTAGSGSYNYLDFLRDLPVTGDCRHDCTPVSTAGDPTPPCVRGQNQWIVPSLSLMPEADYFNSWVFWTTLPFMSPERGCTMQWPVGNWVTMGHPDTYPAVLRGRVLDAPAGSTLTFVFPADSPPVERSFVVPPADPNNPSCRGEPVEIEEPFTITEHAGFLDLKVVVPEACSDMPEGINISFDGETVADAGAPFFAEGGLIVATAGSCTVDDTPPVVEDFSITQLGEGSLEVRLALVDAVTQPGAATVQVAVDGGPPREVVMDYDDPATDGRAFFFKATLGPFDEGAGVEITPKPMDIGRNVDESLPPKPVVVEIVDDDGDGVPDPLDRCLGSNVAPTLVIQGCDTGIPNAVDAEGCTIADRIEEIAESARNHGHFVRGVGRLARELGIEGRDRGRLVSCAARSDFPGGVSFSRGRDKGHGPEGATPRGRKGGRRR